MQEDEPRNGTGLSCVSTKNGKLDTLNIVLSLLYELRIEYDFNIEVF